MSELFRPPAPGPSQVRAWKGRTASDAEAEIRQATEDWARTRWPGYRMVHELVIGQGEARADMAAIGDDHIVGFEIKSAWDNVSRLVHQVGMFRLALPELWLVVDPAHERAAKTMRFLFPTLGVLVIQTAESRITRTSPLEEGKAKIVEVIEAERHAPHWETALALLWVAELQSAAGRLGYGSLSKWTHKKLVDKLMETSEAERIWAISSGLRGRDAVWRADPPLPPIPPPPRG